jgi:hypothetical protein
MFGTYMRLRTTLALALVALLVACGGHEEGHEIEGMLTIDEPTEAPTYETYAQTVRVSGPRYTSVESVTWTNAAGGSGAATLTLQRNCFAFPLPFVFPECNHEWNASVALVVGVNVITVTGYDSDHDFGRDSIAITRRACPAPPPATPLGQIPLPCR